MTPTKNAAAVAMGSMTSARKASAARLNGLKGGRPRKVRRPRVTKAQIAAYHQAGVWGGQARAAIHHARVAPVHYDREVWTLLAVARAQRAWHFARLASPAQEDANG